MVLECRTPGEAKKFGRLIHCRRSWGATRAKSMRWVVRKKFNRNPDLALLLLGTGESELAEGNTWGDTFWGRCGGTGENWLGRILMEERVALRRHGVTGTDWLSRAMRFDGPDYDPALDKMRLTAQLAMIFNLMRDGKWRTFRAISASTGGQPEPSVSAQLRHLRKPRFGSQVVNKVRAGESGLWEYQVEVWD